MARRRCSSAGAELEHGIDATEAVGGGAQHHPEGVLAMAVPHELRDGPAHRVADDDRPVDAEHVQRRHRIVGAVGEAHRALGTDAATVTAVVDGHHAVVLGQRGVGGEPVGVGGDPDAVQEEDRRCAGRRGLVADEGRPAPRQLQRTTGRQPRNPTLRRAVRLGGRIVHWMLTSSTVRLAPVGEVKSTLSPGVLAEERLAQRRPGADDVVLHPALLHGPEEVEVGVVVALVAELHHAAGLHRVAGGALHVSRRSRAWRRSAGSGASIWPWWSLAAW